MSHPINYIIPVVVLIILSGCESDEFGDQPFVPPEPQESNMRWQKSLGGTGFEEYPLIQQTTDGGYIMTAVTTSSDGDVSTHHNTEHPDVWLVKMDHSGAITWEKSLGGSLSDMALTLLQVKEGGYLIGAVSSSADGDVGSNYGSSDWWIVRVDSNGNIIWESNVGGSLLDNPSAAIQVGNEFIIVGITNSTDGDVGNKTSTNLALWVVRMNDSGEILWENTFADNNLNKGVVDIYATSDNGYLVAGSASKDVWLVKFDAEFNLTWEKFLGGSGVEYLSRTARTEDGIILAATTFSTDGDITESFGSGDIWLVEVNEEGEILWEKNYGGSDYDQSAGVVVNTDGGYWVSGSSMSVDGNLTSNRGGLDYWVFRLDSSGNLLKQQSYGGTQWEKARTAAPADSDGILVAGLSVSRDGHIQQYKGQGFIWLTMIE